MKYKSIFLFLTILLKLHSQISANDDHRYYSFQTHFGQFYRADMDSANMIAMLDSVAVANFGAIRDECYWSLIEVNRGEFQFPVEIDNYIHAALDRNIDVLLILNYNNPLYAAHAGSGVETDSNRTAFAKYCQEVVKRYAPLGVKHYEIWNEPNIPIFWDPQPNALDYVKLLEVAYPAIKQIDSTVTVIGCATSPAEGEPAPFISWIPYIRSVFVNGGGAYMDAVSYHQYHVDQNPEANFYSDIVKLQTIIGQEMPMWLTEVGYPTHYGWPYLTEEKQANYAARLFILGKSVDQLQRISYYDLKNDGEVPTEPEHHFGVLNFDLQPKPAYHALKSVARLVGDLPFLNSIIMNNNYIYEFKDEQNWTIAFWNAAGRFQKSIKLIDRFCGYYNREGQLKNYFITGDSTVTVESNERPHYLIGLDSEPVVIEFELLPESIVMYPEQSFAVQCIAKDSEGISIVIDKALLNFEYIGSGGSLDESGRFSAEDIGQGIIIGEFQGIADSISVTIIEDGVFNVNEFESLADWQLTVLNLDSVNTQFSITDSIVSSGNTSGRLDYRFKYQSTIPINKYRAHLKTNIPIPGNPDSLLLDVYGNGFPNRFEFRFRDLLGEYFLKSGFDQPAAWTDQWKPIRVSLSSFVDEIDYPLYLDEIIIYIVHQNARHDSIYQNSMFMDNLRVIKNITNVPVSRIGSLNFELAQNYPNPFNPSTTFKYTLPFNQHVSLKIFNLLGQEFETIYKGLNAAGEHELTCNFSDLTNGLYFYQLKTERFQKTRRMLILK